MYLKKKREKREKEEKKENGNKKKKNKGAQVIKTTRQRSYSHDAIRSFEIQYGCCLHYCWLDGVICRVAINTNSCWLAMLRFVYIL